MSVEFKKIVSVFMLSVFTMSGAIAAGPSDVAQTPQRTPEYSLLRGMFASLGSYNLRTQAGTEQFQKSTQSFVDNYVQNHTADPDEALANMKAALVQLKVFYSPEQADQFLADSQAGITTALSNENPSSQDAVSQNLKSVLTSVANLNLVGDQFSACSLAEVAGPLGFAAIAGAGVTAAIAGIIRLWNPNCSALPAVPVTTTSSVDNSPLGTVTTTTTTMKSPGESCGVNPHIATSDSMLKYAGIIGAAGAVVMTIGLIFESKKC